MNSVGLEMKNPFFFSLGHFSNQASVTFQKPGTRNKGPWISEISSKTVLCVLAGEEFASLKWAS